MSEYTPGPWRLGKNSDSVISETGDAIHGREDKESRDYYGGHLIAESIEPRNRALIAAAPDQNEALIAFEKWWRLPSAERTIEAIEPAMRLALSAIAKAEGRE
jgi:hypothetical protein